MTKAFTALISLAFAASACGEVASSRGTAGAMKEDRGVAVGHVVCTKDGGTKALTPRIRAREEGVHLLIHNRGEAIEFFMRETSSESNHGGRLRERITRDVFTHAPGEIWIACLDRDEAMPPWMGSDERYASFEIVDPDGLWVDYEPECERTEEERGDKLYKAKTVGELEAWVRDRFDIRTGVRDIPGYPGTGWKLPNWVIVEDDRTLAFFMAAKDKEGLWVLMGAEGCVQEG